jgi:hypothetical protein
MSKGKPSGNDRIVSHAVVGVVTGAAVGSQKGWPGFFIGAALGVVAHEALDAPVAGLIADLDLG